MDIQHLHLFVLYVFLRLYLLHERRASIYSERQNNLSFTITPPGDAHDFCKVESAFTRSKNRRGERQKQKFLSFTITVSLLHVPKRADGSVLCIKWIII